MKRVGQEFGGLIDECMLGTVGPLVERHLCLVWAGLFLAIRPVTFHRLWVGCARVTRQNSGQTGGGIHLAALT
eukprot:scaffold156894_cov40-Prasinocladus_malaysianus.AAC.1